MDQSDQYRHQSDCFSIGGIQMHYLTMGNGPRLVLAFHGYGQNAALFHFLQPAECTLLSFDLPYQGKTIMQEAEVLSKENLKELVAQVMTKYKVSKVSLLGFSLGARICLCLVELMPQNIRNVVLVAPDGLSPNYFYRFLTSSALGRFLFRAFVQYGQHLMGVFSFFQRLGVIDRSLYKFALPYIRTKESRQLLYRIWLSTRHLIVPASILYRMMKANNIHVHLIMGHHDRVIPVQQAKKFKGKNPLVHLHIFERGHNLLDFEEVRGAVHAWLLRVPSASQQL